MRVCIKPNLRKSSESPAGIVDIFIYIYIFIYLFILGPVAFNKRILCAYLYEQDQPGKLKTSWDKYQLVFVMEEIHLTSLA